MVSRGIREIFYRNYVSDYVPRPSIYPLSTSNRDNIPRLRGTRRVLAKESDEPASVVVSMNGDRPPIPKGPRTQIIESL